LGLFGNKKPKENISPEEQLARHQSAPRPTAQERARQIYAEQQGKAGTNVVNGLAPLEGGRKIDKKAIKEAADTLQRYKQGKANLEKRIVDNEQWYKLRHWECMRGEKQDIQPASAWLLNAIENKHADAVDNYPSPNILPREAGDKAEAEMLTSIVPVILDHCDFEEVYSDAVRYKLKVGTSAYGVFWDKSKYNGLGDVSICRVDLINLFWESGISDIQKSRNVFHVELQDNDLLLEAYPQLSGKLGNPTLNVSKYIYDDTVDTTEKTPVVDWYYKKMVGGRTVLHYVKFANDEVLYASEDDPNYAERGWYDHGLYPFVFDTLFPVEGTPCGFGFIDVGKQAQEYIDRGDQAILKNMLFNAKPRYFYRADGSISPEDFADTEKELIPYTGTQGPDTLFPVQTNALSSIYYEVKQGKIEELKETTGNRDVSTGGTTSGVTAASGIAAMQEAGSKLSRDMSKASYRAFRQICNIVVELIRQFYDMPRKFRILGENGAAKYITYSNEGIVPQHQGYSLDGEDMGYSQPVFDIEITAQKQSAYSKMAQNELALQFYNAGFFNPQLADQALMCLDMMDFARKDTIMQKIAQNGTMYQRMMAMQQQMLMLGQMVDASRGGNAVTQSLLAQFGAQGGGAMMGGAVTPSLESNEALGGDSSASEAPTTKKARQRVAESTDPT
jgi:hypothetical protein